MSERRTRLVGLYAVIAACIATVVAPLVALSYFATSGGVEQLDSATVSAWAVPGRHLAGGLLTWASPNRVYATYWLVFWALFALVLLCARTVHARRPADVGPLERWGWRLALVGYAMGAAGSLAAIAALIDGTPENIVVDVAFYGLMLPAVLLDAVGSLILGIALLRNGYRPRLTAWLLVLALPSIVVISTVAGNFSLGSLAVPAAWATTGWRLWRADPAQASPQPQPLVDEGAPAATW
jgi:MFS family permease